MTRAASSIAPVSSAASPASCTYLADPIPAMLATPAVRIVAVAESAPTTR